MKLLLSTFKYMKDNVYYDYKHKAFCMFMFIHYALIFIRFLGMCEGDISCIVFIISFVPYCNLYAYLYFCLISFLNVMF